MGIKTGSALGVHQVLDEIGGLGPLGRALAALPGATGEYKFGVYDRERQADDYAEQMGKAVDLKGGKVDESVLSAAEVRP